MDFDSKYTLLVDYVEQIKSKFISTHLEDPLSTPDQYNLDVKSFCILCHAAFEEFIELIALQVMSESIKKYTHEIKISKPLITLMHFKSSHDNYLEKDNENISIEDVENSFNYNRNKLAEVKSKFSNEIYKNNGVSLKYLKKLLMPISLDIPNEINWSNSLEKLTNERGSYAHRFLDEGRVKQSIEPEEAITIVQDCLALCEEIKNRAKDLIP